MYGLIGEKLGHSFSKEIHESIQDYEYELIEIAREDFDSFLKEINFKALNVTIPYKELIIPYLDYISPKAKEIQAVNTVVNKNNKLYGYNTDYLGLKKLIEFNNIDLKNKKVLILGTGGTSKTASVVAKDLNAKEILKVSRNKKDNVITYDEAINNHNDCDIIINATPCGMYPNDDLIMDISNFNNLEAVIDVIYNPLNSKLLREAKKKKIKAINGLYMLVAQAVYASYIFIDKEVEEEKIEEVYNKILKQKQNIVLIGMPSCGKSTIAKKLSKVFKKKVVDTDVLIEKKLKMPISSFLNKDNENEFRDIESEVVNEVSMQNNNIISTGGGVIKRLENIDKLKMNGIIFFIDRSLELLQTTSSRPLSSNINDLRNLYEQRYNIYVNCADYVIKNNDKLENVIKEIVEVYNENFSN